MLGTLLHTNWSQISGKILLLLVIISHKECNGREGRSEEKGGRSQISITIYKICKHKIEVDTLYGYRTVIED